LRRKDVTMTTQSTPIDQDPAEDPRLPEDLVPYVDDRSLPAREVLTAQSDDRLPAESPAIFIP
jgi:hypothetical protein